MIADLLCRIGRACRSRLRVLRSQGGNVSMLFGLAVLPLTFVTGMGIDYGRAMRLQSRLNVAADAAALTAVSRTQMQNSASNAKVLASNMFASQAQPFKDGGDLAMDFTDSAQLTITVTDTTTATNVFRTATVTYRAKSNNIFARLLKMDTLTVKGVVSAAASNAPDIDFYVLMDTSPSMLLPATSAGLAKMTNLTGGCAFACHETSNPLDNYKIAKNNGIVMRADLMVTAVQDLTVTMAATAAQNNVTYRMGLSDFDYMFRPIWPTTPNGGFYVDGNLTTVKTHVTDATVPTYCSNNHRVCGVSDSDTTTNTTLAFAGINLIMPNPGNGSGSGSDTPQAVLFIITDGMRDEMTPTGRVIGPFPVATCTTIKNRGIRIAILNTQYLPESASDAWSIANVKTPYLAPTDKITPALQSCASPGLFYQISTDADISAALTELFRAVVSTSHLTQ